LTSLQASTTRADWGLGLLWVLGTVVGWIVGFTLCEAFNDFLESLSADGVIIGTAVGLGQWLALRRSLPGSAWWIVATLIGFGVGKLLGDAIAEQISGTLGYVLSGAAIGAVLGVAQWVVLRRHVGEAWWWVVASAVAWAVGWGLISAVGEGSGEQLAMTYLVGGVGAAAAGTITGIALVWLLQDRSAPHEPAPM
jgi:hypothetical protein